MIISFIKGKKLYIPAWPYERVIAPKPNNNNCNEAFVIMGNEASTSHFTLPTLLQVHNNNLSRKS